MDTNHDQMVAVLDMPESKLKAKILILAWKELTESFSGPETTQGHVYYRALKKISLPLRKEAVEELDLDTKYADFALA